MPSCYLLSPRIGTLILSLELASFLIGTSKGSHQDVVASAAHAQEAPVHEARAAPNHVRVVREPLLKVGCSEAQGR